MGKPEELGKGQCKTSFLCVVMFMNVEEGSARHGLQSVLQTRSTSGSPWTPLSASSITDTATSSRCGLEKRLEKMTHGMFWRRKQVDAQLRRNPSLQLLGSAWDLLHTEEYVRLREAAWSKTGASSLQVAHRMTKVRSKVCRTTHHSTRERALTRRLERGGVVGSQPAQRKQKHIHRPRFGV